MWPGVGIEIVEGEVWQAGERLMKEKGVLTQAASQLYRAGRVEDNNKATAVLTFIFPLSSPIPISHCHCEGV